MAKLLSPYTIRNVTLKNRIVMSPMCMYSASDDGYVTDWHIIHYASRAAGQVGLIVIEATAVTKEGRISAKDLGIWDDSQIEGLKKLTNAIKENGAHAAIQLAHAGRKANCGLPTVAPSAVTYSNDYPIPHELSKDEIQDLIESFKLAAIRSEKAGFDIIEIHGAHGYLINQFLSPLSNKRTDEYGGSIENRYRFLKEIIAAVKSVWDGPLFVRLSLDEYHEEGNTQGDFAYVIQKSKEQQVDLIDCSSGAVVPNNHIDVFPGYQVHLAEWVKKQGIASGAVGLITSPLHAEEILKNNRADLVFLGRELLRNPYWPLTAAEELRTWIDGPNQYVRGWKDVLPQNKESTIWAPGKDAVR